MLLQERCPAGAMMRRVAHRNKDTHPTLLETLHNATLACDTCYSYADTRAPHARKSTLVCFSMMVVEGRT
jgi:hypothetical protein